VVFLLSPNLKKQYGLSCKALKKILNKFSLLRSASNSKDGRYGLVFCRVHKKRAGPLLFPLPIPPPERG
jgi:hypothetical protein